MKRYFILLTLLFISLTGYCSDNSENNKFGENFSDFGRYVATLETSEGEYSDLSIPDEPENDFEEISANDVLKRYEDNAVELKVNDSKDAVLNSLNSDRLDKIKINETKYNTEKGIINEKAYSKSSESFSQKFSLSHSKGSGQTTLKTKDINLPFNSGSINFGSSAGAKDTPEGNKTNGDIFGEYTYKRLKLNTQLGQTRNFDSHSSETDLSFSPEYRLTESLALKSKIVKNVTENSTQDELGFSYTPKKGGQNLSFELNAANYYNESERVKQRIKFSTSFKI